jgi:hypothetical protein
MALTEEEAVYEVFGRAMDAWQRVEGSMWRTLHEIIDCKNYDLISAAFFSIYGLQDKIRMVNAVISIALKDDPRLTGWAAEKTGFRDRIASASRARNKLAHYEVRSIKKDGKETWFLGRHSLDKRYDSVSAADGLTWEDLLKYGLTFSKLANDLWDYAGTLVAPKPWLGIPPGLLAQALRQFDPTSLETETQESPPPPEPSPEKPES